MQVHTRNAEYNGCSNAFALIAHMNSVFCTGYVLLLLGLLLIHPISLRPCSPTRTLRVAIYTALACKDLRTLYCYPDEFRSALLPIATFAAQKWVVVH